jgi:hypothetical protein
MSEEGTRHAGPLRVKELPMSDERVAHEDQTSSAETENDAEVNRQSPAESEEKKEEIEYDEFLDDRFQATDN